MHIKEIYFPDLKHYTSKKRKNKIMHLKSRNLVFKICRIKSLVENQILRKHSKNKFCYNK